MNSIGTPADEWMNIGADPRFVDGETYQLKIDSPLVRAAVGEGAPAIDFDGDLRFSPPDIGYDEVAKLHIELPSHATFESDSMTLAVRRNSDSSKPLKVQFQSIGDLDNIIQPLAPVTIETGSPVANDLVSPIDNKTIAPSLQVSLIASAIDHLSDRASFTIVDDDRDPPVPLDHTEIRINSTLDGDQTSPSVGLDDAGNAVVVWVSQETPGSAATDVVARRLGLDGRPIGSEFRINADARGTQQSPVVSVHSDGSFVVAWLDLKSGGNNGDRIVAQRFDASGIRLGSEFQVHNTGVESGKGYPAIGMNEVGEFVIAWTSYGQDGDATNESNIYVRQFFADGRPRGDEFLVNSFTAGGQHDATLAVNRSGRFVVVWRGQHAHACELSARIFGPDGQPISSEFAVDSGIFSIRYVSAAMVGSGDFVVVWDDFTNRFIGGRVFRANGNPLGGVFQTAFTGAVSHPTVAPTADGNYAIAWRSVEPRS